MQQSVWLTVLCRSPCTTTCVVLQTTLVKYILEEQHGHRIAVILNEFGEETGIESAFVQDGQVRRRWCDCRIKQVKVHIEHEEVVAGLGICTRTQLPTAECAGPLFRQGMGV